MRESRTYNLNQRLMNQKRKEYQTKEWKALRARVLGLNKFCVSCEADGVITQATVCDHIVNHRKNNTAFYPHKDEGETDEIILKHYQGLCHQCHADKTYNEVYKRPSRTYGEQK